MGKTFRILCNALIKVFVCSALAVLCINPVVILAQAKNAKKPAGKTVSGNKGTRASTANSRNNDAT